jgi:outer membrane receptor protein involved in Fe transport
VLCTPLAAAPSAWRGLPLAAALEALRDGGLDVIYSSELVTPEMRVSVEPQADTPREILDAILLAEGLEAREGPGGRLLVVRVESSVSTLRGRGDARVEPDPIYQLTETVRVTAEAPESPDGSAEYRRSGNGALADHDALAGDPLRAVAALPGVVGSDESSKLHVRGGVDDEVLVVFDGLELYEPFHLPERGGLFSVIDGDAVGSVSVLGGGLPARYGGRMSGILEIESVDPAGGLDSALHAGSDGYRVAGQGGLLEGRGDWLGSFRVGEPTAVLDALGVDPDYEPRYYDALGKLSFRPSDRTSLAVQGMAVLDELEGSGDRLVTARGEELKAESSQRYLWITLDHRFSPRLNSRTMLSGGWLSSSRLGTTPEIDGLRDRRSTQLLGLEQDWTLSAGRHVFGWGFDLDHLQSDYRYVLEPSDTRSAARDLDLHPSGMDAAFYLSDRIRVTPRLDLELGARWSGAEYAPGGTRLAGRVNADYRLTSRTLLHAAWGQHDQPQRIDELQVEDGVSAFHEVQRAEHRSLGLDQALPGGLRLGVTAYDKRMSSLAPRFENLFDPYSLFPEAALDRVAIEPASARSRGLELTLTGDAARRFDWWASYAVSSSTDRLDGRDVPRAWDEPQRLSWGAAFEPAAGWRVGARGLHHTGHPTTPVSGVLQALADGSSTIVPVLGERNSDRLPTYHRLDVDLVRTLRLGGGELRLWGGVVNLLDRSNVCCTEDFRFVLQPDGSVTTQALEHDGLGRLFTWGLSWSF